MRDLTENQVLVDDHLGFQLVFNIKMDQENFCCSQTKLLWWKEDFISPEPKIFIEYLS